jgi:hypothetical protein
VLLWEDGDLPDELHDCGCVSDDPMHVSQIKVEGTRWIKSNVREQRIAKTSTSRRFKIT